MIVACPFASTGREDAAPAVSRAGGGGRGRVGSDPGGCPDPGLPVISTNHSPRPLRLESALKKELPRADSAMVISGRGGYNPSVRFTRSKQDSRKACPVNCASSRRAAHPWLECPDTAGAMISLIFLETKGFNHAAEYEIRGTRRAHVGLKVQIQVSSGHQLLQ